MQQFDPPQRVNSSSINVIFTLCFPFSKPIIKNEKGPTPTVHCINFSLIVW